MEADANEPRKRKKPDRKRSASGLKNPLLFVDTNIFLDFYRARNEQSLDLLQRLESVKDRLVTTYQVEMEFKKHRQAVIAESMRELSVKDVPALPSFLANHQTAETLKTKRGEIRARLSKLKKLLHAALLHPTTRDPVYIVAQRLLSENNDCPLNLKRTDNQRRMMRRRGFRRFILGYPPRKKGDSSIGDAFNWEWIIECAIPEKRDIVIVSRDSDYGVTIDSDSYINDWLREEFKDRVSLQGQVVLTSLLTMAFKHLQEPVTEQESKAEQDLVAERKDPNEKKAFDFDDLIVWLSNRSKPSPPTNDCVQSDV